MSMKTKLKHTYNNEVKESRGSKCYVQSRYRENESACGLYNFRPAEGRQTLWLYEIYCSNIFK